MKKLSKRKVKERRKKGIVKAYISRAAAVRKLQIPLADFRRLCILKGIYPVEPKNKSKLTGGNTQRKTYFFNRDIQYLMNEPIMFKFWEFKLFMKRLSRAKGRHDLEKFKQTIENKPIYKLDNVVKERYPKFVDALRDCDDALNMCFLFAMFPKGRGRPDDLIDMSRRLTLEFMHYVVHSKSLRKVFISIKGYYYQAEVSGQTVTWMVPHQFVIDRTSNVDLNVMKTFTEFYVTLLGFINFRLFASIGARYPPHFIADNIKDITTTRSHQLKNTSSRNKRKLEDTQEAQDELLEDYRDDLIAALNKKLSVMEHKSVVNVENEDQQIDKFEEPEEHDLEDETKKGDKEMTIQQTLALERLFGGLKFFLNREVPRESLTFVIRSFGGEVSWDQNLFPGSTFDESDPSITHQIIDRNSIPEQRLNRIYVQPQWVYDSINCRMLLPTSDYLIGAALPPHLSPFVSEKRGDYMPPDKIKLMNLRKQFEAENVSEEKERRGEGQLDSDLETDAELENQTEEDMVRVSSTKRPKLNKSNSRSKMTVKRGNLNIQDKSDIGKQEDQEHRKLGIMMIPKKKRRLFDKITKTHKDKARKADKMRSKRKIVDAVKKRGHKFKQ